jgi:hypothetical protein
MIESDERLAPLSKLVSANQRSNTLFHGASVASLYLSSEETEIRGAYGATKGGG